MGDGRSVATPAEITATITTLEAGLRDDPDGVLRVVVDGVDTTFEKTSEKIAALEYWRRRLATAQQGRRLVRPINMSRGSL